MKRKQNEIEVIMQLNSKTQQTQTQRISLKEQLVLECTAMAKHAFASGLQVPGNVIRVLNHFSGEKTWNGEMDTGQLILAHEQLAKIVDPAKPRTILLMDIEAEQAGVLKFLGAVPFIRRMMLAAIICLILFITISLSPEINNRPESWNLFQSSGWALLLKELFLLSAAGLGASFTALFKANRYIVEGTFDPKYESSYWIRFSLGFIAGMILATLIPIEESMNTDFGKPLLAMLGGFSADLVYRVIARIIETLESLFRGDTRSLVQAKEEQAKARTAEENIKNRIKAASNIMKLQQDIDPDTKPEDIKKKMGTLLNDMVGIDSGENFDVTKENKEIT